MIGIYQETRFKDPISLKDLLNQLRDLRLLNGSADFYEFSHKTMQEFLAAYYVFIQIRINFHDTWIEWIKDVKLNSAFEVVLPFISGLLAIEAQTGNLNHFFKILQETPHEFFISREVGLWARCLEECYGRVEVLDKNVLLQKIRPGINFALKNYSPSVYDSIEGVEKQKDKSSLIALAIHLYDQFYHCPRICTEDIIMTAMTEEIKNLRDKKNEYAYSSQRITVYEAILQLNSNHGEIYNQFLLDLSQSTVDLKYNISNIFINFSPSDERLLNIAELFIREDNFDKKLCLVKILTSSLFKIENKRSNKTIDKLIKSMNAQDDFTVSLTYFILIYSEPKRELKEKIIQKSTKFLEHPDNRIRAIAQAILFKEVPGDLFDIYFNRLNKRHWLNDLNEEANEFILKGKRLFIDPWVINTKDNLHYYELNRKQFAKEKKDINFEEITESKDFLSKCDDIINFWLGQDFHNSMSYTQWLPIGYREDEIQKNVIKLYEMGEDILSHLSKENPSLYERILTNISVNDATKNMLVKHLEIKINYQKLITLCETRFQDYEDSLLSYFDPQQNCENKYNIILFICLILRHFPQKLTETAKSKLKTYYEKNQDKIEAQFLYFLFEKKLLTDDDLLRASIRLYLQEGYKNFSDYDNRIKKFYAEWGKLYFSNYRNHPILEEELISYIQVNNNNVIHYGNVDNPFFIEAPWPNLKRQQFSAEFKNRLFCLLKSNRKSIISNAVVLLPLVASSNNYKELYELALYHYKYNNDSFRVLLDGIRKVFQTDIECQNYFFKKNH